MEERPRVLLVDDDTRLLDAARRLLRQKIELETAPGAIDALHMLGTRKPYHVIVSDQSMPDVDGVTLLTKVAERWPNTVRIMMTGNQDPATASQAINDGRIFRFIRKPCQPDDLLEAVMAGARQHALLEAERTLLERTLSGSVKMLTDVLALSRPEVYRRGQIIQSWARALSPHLGLKNPWQLHLSAMLCLLGIIALPEDMARKALSGAAMTPEEEEAVAQAPAAAHDLIRNIPRLAPVADAILHSRSYLDASGTAEDIPFLSRVLALLIDLAAMTAERGMSIADALAEAKAHHRRYDPLVLAKAFEILPKMEDLTGAQRMERRLLSAIALVEGDQVADDVRDRDGRLLLAAGSQLSRITIQRLKALAGARHLTGDIAILRATAG